MFLGPFFTKLRTSIFKATTNKVIPINKNSSASKETTKSLRPQASKNPIRTNNHSKSLNEIEKRIKNGGATNELLLEKSEALLSNGKFRQAREILINVSKNRKDSKASGEAQQLLKTLPTLQQEAKTNRRKKLISDLHRISQKYDKKLLNLPSSENIPSNLDIVAIVRQEAHLARSAELPKLSYEMIEETLQAGQESPWLLHDKALSLGMMGQQLASLEILRDLKKTTKREKLTNSINKNINNIQRNSKNNQTNLKIYFAKQSKLIAKNSGLDTKFIPEAKQIDEKSRVKFLVFRKARAILSENPKASLSLANSILDFFQGDLAALQLKGEALAALKRHDDAINIWKVLVHSQNKKIAKKASELISNHLSKRALAISTKKSSKSALLFFIKEHLKCDLAPNLDKNIKEIFRQQESTKTKSVDPELQKHQRQIQFNTLVIECLETQLRDRGRLDASPTAQKPGTISKTALKAD